MNQLDKILWETHQAAARRENASTGIVKVSFVCNGNDVVKSIVAGLMSMGGRHAPIKETFQMIDDLINYNYYVDDLSHHCGMVIPGFGSSFVKGGHDPILAAAHDCMSKYYPAYIDLTRRIREYIKDKLKKDLYPNLAFYTACHAHINRINIIYCEELMIKARVDAWLNILKEGGLNAKG